MRRRLLPDFLFLTHYRMHHRIAACVTVLLPWLLLAGNSPADIGICLVGILFLYESIVTRDWRWIRQPWIYCLGILFLYMCARSLFTPVPEDAFSRSLTFLRYPLFAIAMSCWVWRMPEMHRTLFFSLATSIIFLFFDCFLQYAVGYDVIGRAAVDTSLPSQRLTGPFSAPKVGIHLVWMTFPVLAVIVSHSALSLKRRDNIIGILFVMLFLTVIFITGERMAFLLTLFGCAIFFIAYPPLRKGFTVMLLFGMLTISLFAQYNPALVTRQYFSTVDTIHQTKESAYGQIWKSSLRMWEAYPLFGVGPKHFRHYCPEERFGDIKNHPERCNLHPHQLYLEWAVETGAVGLMLFIAMISAMLTPVLLCYKRLKQNPLYAGLLIAMILRLWPFSTAISFFANWSAIPFWFIAGWLLAITFSSIPHKEAKQ